jgi:hypothetical protein
MRTSDPALARTIEARVLASQARQIATEIRSVAARHTQIAGELWVLANDGHQSHLIADRLQREFDETEARSQRLLAASDEIEARRRELLTPE